MRYAACLFLIATLFGACKKSSQYDEHTFAFEKVYGTYGGKIDYNSYSTIKDTTTGFDTTFNTSITVSALTGDSIAVYITPYNRTFRIKYEGHNVSSGWSFMSHPGGTEYKFKYNPENDSATFYYNQYSTNYVTPRYASGTSYTFKGKKQ